GCTAANSPTIECTPGTVGNYTVVVHATDSVGANVSASARLSITPYQPPGGGTGLSLSPTVLGLLLVVAVAVVAGVTIALLARRRRYK
ncbi:MAG TPA: hypothetical protein VGP88_01180, partial [Thermoplasmata archaeon]|nr:hypothetical protein [Thermoplasmata archaeon]